jgi:hypothetical protein
MAKNSKTTMRARQGPAARKQKPRRSPSVRATSGAARRRSTETPSSRKRGPGSRPQSAETIATNFTFYANPTLTLVCMPSAAPVLFPLEVAADLTGVHPEMLRYYCRLGLLGDQRAGMELAPTFDEDALCEVRRIEHYRRHLAVSRRALPLLCELRREAERQQIEIHFLRDPEWSRDGRSSA